MVLEHTSVINYIQPDKIDPDGTLYYYPFKIVPLINLIKATNRGPGYNGHDPTLPLNFIWQSNADPAIITFQIVTEPTDEYLPVGDLCFNVPNDGDNGRNHWINDLLNPILNSNNPILSEKVLFVKNDDRYCKKLKDNDFDYVADDSGGGGEYNLRILASNTRNNTLPQQTGEYIILSDLVSREDTPILNQKTRNGENISKQYSKIRQVVAVNKNYVVSLPGYSWLTDTGNWDGISGAGYVRYSSPFVNTFFTNAGRSNFIFYDIVPESVSRLCCSSTQTLKFQPYCKILSSSDQKTLCKTMMNTFCSGKTLETPECRKWCGSDGVYCDEKILEHCKTVDLNAIVNNSNTTIIKPDSYKYYKIENFKVDPRITGELKKISSSVYDTCKTQCDKTYECDAFSITGNECTMYKKTDQYLNIDASLIASNGTTTYLKNREDETLAEVQKQLCSCFKDDEYYTNYINNIASKYPPDVRKMLLLSTLSRDKRCLYSECSGGYSLQHKNFRDNNAVCGDNNIQICFQNITTDGSLQNSSLDNSQVNSCRMQVQDSSSDNSGTQQDKTYMCDSTNYTCVESDLGTYNSITDCNASCTKPTTNKADTAKSNGKLSTAAWIGIIVAVVVMIIIIVIVAMT
jgi:hypothetical protein